MNPQQALAGVVVDELVRLGVREVVLAPGSRSAPLAYALHDAETAGRVRVHVRVDERSAAFLALGLAKGTGMPAPVVTTSGTAVANLMPAVLEAHEAGVPMLLLTADRPPELRGTRANQTTDQIGFFARFARWSHDLGVPEARVGAQAAWRTAVDRAVAAATGALGGDAGPVHLNVPLRDPLVPDAAGGTLVGDVARRGDRGTRADDDAARTTTATAGEAEGAAGGDSSADPPVVGEVIVSGVPGEAERGRPGGAWPESLDGRADGGPWTRTDPRAPSWGSPPLRPEPRTLVVLGDAPRYLVDDAMAWAARVGHPVIGEPFGPSGPSVAESARGAHGVRLAAAGGAAQGGRLPHGVRLAARVAEDDALRPARIVVVGRLTLSRSLARLLRIEGVRIDLITADTRWPDPGHVVHAVHDPGALRQPPTAEGVADPTERGAPSSAGAIDEPAAPAVHGLAHVAPRGRTTAEPVDEAFRRAWVTASAEESASLRARLDDPRTGGTSAGSTHASGTDADAALVGSPRARRPDLGETHALGTDGGGVHVVGTAADGPPAPAAPIHEESLAWPSGPALADAMLTALPERSRLFLGSSNGVRHVDLVRGLRGGDRAEVLASRGLAGIDGCVSTAAGLALADDRPTYALLGDLTFLHDTNGLLIGPGEPVPDLTIVVGNDDGGAIFGDLEYGQVDRRERHPGVFERMFRTSTGTDLAPLCAAHGVRHVRAETPEALTAQVSRVPRGLTVVEVRLPTPIRR